MDKKTPEKPYNKFNTGDEVLDDLLPKFFGFFISPEEEEYLAKKAREEARPEYLRVVK